MRKGFIYYLEVDALYLEHVQTVDQLELIRVLFREYQDSLNISLCFQNFEQELANLPDKYAAPQGRLYLVTQEGEAIGCIALRPIDNECCEMKRLYIKPKFRQLGFGRAMVARIVKDAQEIGYNVMYLDTLPQMQSAIKLYKNFGFKETEAYCFNPVCGAVYMLLDLKVEEERDV